MVSESAVKVPHLTTALKGPLPELEKHLLKQQIIIEAWLREQWAKTPPTFYSSVDLRNAGFKLAPVDTNLFPAGFNNLNPDFIPLCIQAVQSTMEHVCPSVSHILLIPESHTRNIFYFEHLAALCEILHKAGFIVRVGSLSEEITETQEIALPSGKRILLSPLKREGNRVGVDDFTACLILLNNDLSDGIPPILQNLEQTIMPPLNLGWHTRLKSVHFQHYQDVAEEFSKKINIDPWLISPMFRVCGEVDFMQETGLDCIITNTDLLLKAIQKKYDEYEIHHKPFVMIKADAGTYGMAVMSISDPEQLRKLNRKQRTKMATIKGGQAVNKVLIQEGVYTFETWDDAAAEPVVYMIGKYVVGGFYRVHAQKGTYDNLNAPGMNFQPLAFAQSCNNPCDYQENCCNRFYAYGVIARLALVAAARELFEKQG